MKLYPLILVALLAGSMIPGVAAEDALEKKKQEEAEKKKSFSDALEKSLQKDREEEEEKWKKFYAELNKFFDAVPTARKLDKTMEDMTAVLLSVQDEATAHEAAVKIKKMDEESLLLKTSHEQAMAAYAKEKDLKNSPEIKVYVNVLQTRFSWMREATENITSQGLITKELAEVLNMQKVPSVTPCPAMSPERTDYWKRQFANKNRMNRVLYSLRDKSDMPRVIKELKEIKKEDEALNQLDRNGPPLKESDKEGSEVMFKRFQQGPVRMANVMMAIMDARRFINTEDPEVQEVKKLIHDLG